MLLTRSCFLGPSELNLQSRGCDWCRTLKIHTKPWLPSVTGRAELTANLLAREHRDRRRTLTIHTKPWLLSVTGGAILSVNLLVIQFSNRKPWLLSVTGGAILSVNLQAVQ